MQCVTGEAVLRLDRSRLSSDKMEIQEVYMEEQSHESLLQYYLHHMKNEQEQLYIQVTAKLVAQIIQ